MKKTVFNVKVLVMTAVAILAMVQSFAKKAPPPYITEEFSPDITNKSLGYQLIKGGELIVFVFDAQNYKIPLQKIKKVYVSGSFNSWAKTQGAWALDVYKGGIYTLIVNTSEVMIPGASGFPEFKFFVIHDTDYIQVICGKSFPKTREDRILYDTCAVRKGFQFLKSNLILLDNKDVPEIIQNEKAARKTLNPPKDYKKRGPDGFAEYANFRKLPSLPLYRGYHPYKRSAKLLSDDDVMRSTVSQEKARIRSTNTLIEQNNIKSIITLTGNEQINPKKEKVSNYVQAINHDQNRLFLDLSGMEIFRITGGRTFGEEFAKVVRFVLTHPKPVYMHCHQGIDETGVISAFLEAMAGCSWTVIREDFEKSGKAGIGMYRNYRLLEYSFERMIQKKPGDAENLQEEVVKHFIDGGYLTAEEVKDFQALAGQ